MKTKLLYLLVIALMWGSCRKAGEQIIPASSEQTKQQTLQLAEVKAWYQGQTNLQTTDNTSSFKLSKLAPNWDKAESVAGKKQNYWLIHLTGQPTFKNKKQGYRKMAVMRDSTGNLQVRILEIVPDGIYWQRKGKVSTNDFTGYVFIYDQEYHYLGGKIYKSGKQVGESRFKVGTGTKLATNMIDVSVDCAWYDSSYIDAEGVFTIHSDQICSYTIYDNGFYPDNGTNGGSVSGDPLGGGGGGGGDAAAAPEVSNLPGENSPKIDPKAYMNCFGSLPDVGSKMKITVYVQEPMPGLPFNYGSNSVGHVAIGLTKTYNGQTITQVVGLYPDATGKSRLHAPSKVLDNSFIEYNVSVTYDIIASEFNKIVAFVANPPSTYDLTEYNCTNFVFDACKSGGITLPNPNGNTGIFSGGSAMTPGALGSSISDSAGALNVNNNGGTVPQSHGPCN